MMERFQVGGRSLFTFLVLGCLFPSASAAQEHSQHHSHYGNGGGNYHGSNPGGGAGGSYPAGYLGYGNYGLNVSVPLYGGYLPYYGYGSGRVQYGAFGWGPLFVPADALFGPGPLMSTLGNLSGDAGAVRGNGMAGNGLAGNGMAGNGGGNAAGGNAAGGNAAGGNAQQGKAAGAAGPAPPIGNFIPPAKKIRATNAEAKTRAGKFVHAGDTQFEKQSFHQALERYREGSVAAPDMADCFFRQAFAQIALGNYAAGAKALFRGLQIQPDWPESNFELPSLYGEKHRMTKLSHREALAQAIEQNPHDASLMTMMGTMLYFDGERDRSRIFFQRAIQLGGNVNHLLDPFLVEMPAPGAKL